LAALGLGLPFAVSARASARGRLRSGFFAPCHIVFFGGFITLFVIVAADELAEVSRRL
jgi:hypothetical protein